MGILVAFLTYLVVGLLAIILAPVLYAWVTKKVIVFENAIFKEYAYFWVLLILLGVVFQVLYVATTQVIYGMEQSIGLYVRNYSNLSALIGFATEVLLAKWIFRESYWKAFKASIVYTILLVLSLMILFFVGIWVGLSAFVGG